MQMHQQVTTEQFVTRKPSEFAGVVYSYQSGRYGNSKKSPPEFCNLLGQDKHVLMTKNNQYAFAGDPFKMQVGSLALCGHEALDIPNGIGPYVLPSGIHDVHIVPVDRTNSMQRQTRLKGQWGVAEDRILSKLVKRYGSRHWSLISTFMASEYYYYDF